MRTYISKSSSFVKVATFGTITALSIASVGLILTTRISGLIGGIILATLIVATVLYFYSNSLDKIIIEKDVLILKKKYGQVRIPPSDIKEISKFGYSNLTMTYGSKGVFGFIGNTMDNSVSFVKDRGNMIQVKTRDKKYVFSSERPDELIKEIKTLYNIV